MANKKELIDELIKLADEETDPLLKTWYTTTCSIVRDANEMKPGYDEAAHRTLEATLKTLYPDADTSEEGLEKATFVGALASTANVVRKEILKMRELKRCKSQKTIDVIYNLFHPPVYGKDDEIVIEKPQTAAATNTAINTASTTDTKIPVVKNAEGLTDPRKIFDGCLHTRSIDWLARIDRSKYSIRTDGKVINNHQGGKIVLSFMKDGNCCVKLKSGKHNVTMPVHKLMATAFPERACVNDEKQRINLEAVTKPVELNTLVTTGPIATNTTDFVWVDWMSDIPKNKYKVYSSGTIFNIVSGKPMIPDVNGNISLSNILSEDQKCKRGNVHKKIMASSVIWKAFHPEDRDKVKLRLKYRDENRENIALENLYLLKANK